MLLSKPYDGFLFIDKPIGVSSFDVIRKLRQVTTNRKIGHTGTLDPFASGLMVYCFNRYTRLASFIEAQDKVYYAKIRFGLATDTGDLTGKIIANDDNTISSINTSKLEAAVLSINELETPKFSAVKVNGIRAYKLARKNQEMEIPKRKTHIYDFMVIDFQYPYLEYRCRVSKGTYIRSLSIWIAEFLGTIGHTIELRREAIGKIDISQSTSLNCLNESNWTSYLKEAYPLLDNMEALLLADSDIIKLLNGRSIEQIGLDTDKVAVYDQKEHIVSVCKRANNTLIPIINLG